MGWLDNADVKTSEEKLREYESNVQRRLTEAVQKHMDSVAQQRNYDNIISCCTYANSKNPKFSAEGQSAVEWRDEVWVVCYGVLDEVKSGQRSIPTKEELINLLPTIEWPLV